MENAFNRSVLRSNLCYEVNAIIFHTYIPMYVLRHYLACELKVLKFTLHTDDEFNFGLDRTSLQVCCVYN